MKTKVLAIIIATFFGISFAQAQNDEAIDASKPTNFYSLFENNAEFQSTKNGNLFGYRGNLILAPSDAHLVLAEVPILYNDKTNKGGLGDVRARYFFLPYKNYDKFVGAFGPSIDVFAPTGNFEHGLGSDSWIFAPGVTVGLMAHEKFQFFPILSYQYKSGPTSDAGKAAGLKETHGATFQVITPIVFSEKFFVQVTPNFRINDFKNANVNYVQEALASYALKEKLMLNAYYSGDFKAEAHTVRAGFTIYL